MRINCLPYKIALALVIAASTVLYLYSLGGVLTTKVALSDSVALVITRHEDRASGEFFSRSVDIFVAGKRIKRVWCSPMPSNTGGTGCFVALCQGETAKYVAILDGSAVWIIDLRNPAEVRTTFHEKNPPTIESEFNVTDVGNVVPMPAKFSYWMEGLNQKRTLLEQ